jgi:hypothetical protein
MFFYFILFLKKEIIYWLFWSTRVVGRRRSFFKALETNPTVEADL